jgi:hypothetical protein
MMMGVHHGMTFAASDQPAIHREGYHRGDGE